MRVFVHLAYGFGAANWQKKFRNGTVIGINESPPYGYHHASSPDVEIQFSQDRGENVFSRIVRYSVRVLLGFDLLHAFYNKRGFLKADVIWTHTESQYLAVNLILILLRRSDIKVIAQTVWLIDQWSSIPFFKRVLYRILIDRANVMTFLSTLNKAKAETLFPRASCRLVRFGICADNMATREQREINAPGQKIRILAVGNDRHRDWVTFLKVVGGWDRCESRVATRSIEQKVIRDFNNVVICSPRNNEELLSLYDWADLLLVILKPNLHASGITVIQEAVSQSLPVLASNVGGLDIYFGKDEIFYLEEFDATSIRGCIEAVASNLTDRTAYPLRAQMKMKAELNSVLFAQQHVLISEEMLHG